MSDTGTIGAARAALRSSVRSRTAGYTRSQPSTGAQYSGKRVFDAVAATVLLILLSPFLVVVWCAVRLTSAGPGLHWSRRVGRDGRLFSMPKFRTMRMDAPLGPRESLRDANSLITPLGRFLRRFSLDELPQLICIIFGKMSFVGPRPLLPADPGAEARRHFPSAFSVRPGLTGIAQISGRNRLNSRRKARLDAFYARMATATMDARIMARTIVVVLSGRGFM